MLTLPVKVSVPSPTAKPQYKLSGAAVGDGTLTLTGNVNINQANQLIIPTGIEADVQLNLQQKIITDISPDDNGIDIKEATIELPKTLHFTLNHSGQSMDAAAASWNLYGQPINFAFDNTRPMRWSPEVNRILLPYKADVAEMEVLQ